MRVKVTTFIRWRMKGYLLKLAVAGTLGVVTAGILSSVALAQEGGSGTQLKSAKVELTPVKPGELVRVSESIELNEKPDGPIENVMPILAGAEVRGLKIISGGREISPTVKKDADLKKVSFEPPGGGGVSYKVTYDVATEGSRTPLLVPSYAGGGGRVVKLTYHVPDGYYLQGSPFPVVFDSTGDVGRNLQALPTFTDYEVASSPAGPFTATNIFGAVVIVFIVGLSVLVFFVESRASSRGGEVGV